MPSTATRASTSSVCHVRALAGELELPGGTHLPHHPPATRRRRPPAPGRVLQCRADTKRVMFPLYISHIPRPLTMASERFALQLRSVQCGPAATLRGHKENLRRVLNPNRQEMFAVSSRRAHSRILRLGFGGKRARNTETRRFSSPCVRIQPRKVGRTDTVLSAESNDNLHSRRMPWRSLSDGPLGTRIKSRLHPALPFALLSASTTVSHKPVPQVAHHSRRRFTTEDRRFQGAIFVPLLRIHRCLFAASMRLALCIQSSNRKPRFEPRIRPISTSVSMSDRQRTQGRLFQVVQQGRPLPSPGVQLPLEHSRRTASTSPRWDATTSLSRSHAPGRTAH
ncbi:hypothetical protein L1887_59658 [Cichorium endivia]|nr:hypothetical protein L1887_59658 [Cichorium endivia]